MTRLIKLFSILSLILPVACTNPANTYSTIDSTAIPKDSAENFKVENKGVNIAYDDSKKGDTTLVFIHGWGINRSYWGNQDTVFAKHFRVIEMDLPGFGESGKNRKSWTVEDYANDVSAVLNGLDLKNVILIGHSMSGAIALEAALNNQPRVIGLIGIDNFNTYGAKDTPQSKKETEAFFEKARAHYKKTVTAYVKKALFAPSTPKSIRKRVVDDIANSDSTIALDCIEQSMSYQGDEKLKNLKMPLYLINSSANPTDTVAFRKNGIAYRFFNVGKTGHYPMLEKPEKFNALLEKAIDDIKSIKK
ncbi:alpha/beta fold hydrolase [Emticicia sp. BO119]|uniref:alpha/beta fold hydrolase n=1 Tax=Emticicia sp. BO119 TaxID=2757768 RepID=UPI0015EFEAF6|nr:alpha/beta hydrolase [Emticicia sp. BO119]MBA4853876.1 alpha/beta hydrolase [Emticicia sp. BO119]